MSEPNGRPDDGILTLYGRKPVLEALQSDQVDVVRLHLARGLKASPLLREIDRLARERNVEVRRHTRLALSRISGNARQDQGVAVDIVSPRYRHLDDLTLHEPDIELMALERVTNPQNLGMIIRSVAASPLAGMVLPRQGSARLDGLVMKASAGTLFRCPIYYCEEIVGALDLLTEKGFEIIGLSARGEAEALTATPTGGRRVLILGNETEGLSGDVEARCHRLLRIPLGNGVESLNVGAAASIIAFRSIFCD